MKGASVSSETRQTGSSGLVDQATSGLGDAASSVQEKAGELKVQGRSKLGETLDQRTTQAGGQARQMAGALRQTGSQLRSQGESGNRQMAGLVEAAADRVENLGGYLQRTSGDGLLRDAEDLARRRPWMVAGIGLVAGLAASRFLKASSERRYDGRTSGYPSSYMYGTRGNGQGTSSYEPYAPTAGMEVT